MKGKHIHSVRAPNHEEKRDAIQRGTFFIWRESIHFLSPKARIY